MTSSRCFSRPATTTARPMSDEELRDELVTVLGAGHETTATGLAWAIERLLRNPEVLGRLRDSIAAGEDEYLDATIKETLRARPVIVDVARKLTAPIELDGYEIPAGTFVLPAIAALHYREDLFPEPERFRPERFLEARPTTTPGSRSAAACAAASAPPSPNTRCGSFCASSSTRRAQRPRPAAGEGQGPQHHPRPGTGDLGQARPASELSARSAASHSS